MQLTTVIVFSLFCYVIDLSLAILGWTIGFGLTVQNWPALIGFAIVGRWVFHVTQAALLREMREEKK